MDYPGKVITKTQVTPTQTSASGNWTLDDQAAAIKNNNWPVALVPNPISKSLRFNSADSAYLNRTFGTPTNNKIFTYNCWVKVNAAGNSIRMLTSGITGSPVDYAMFQFSPNSINYQETASSATALNVSTVAVFRDPSAWYMVTLVVDTTLSTATDRIKIYVNSVLQTLTIATQVTQNYDPVINKNTRLGGIGGLAYNGSYINFSDCYLTEINFIDGQALTPSSFGMTNPQTGQWIPLKYSGTYGTNGFYLNFKDATSTTTLGYDYSGNANNWTTNNFSVTAGAGNDSLTDVPTPWFAYNTTGDVGGVIRGNYATWNPIEAPSASAISDGNLQVVLAATGTSSTPSSIAVSSGKWYSEVTFSATGSGNAVGVGVGPGGTYQPNIFSVGVSYYAFDGTKYVSGTGTSYGSSWTTNDIIGIALDVDGGTVTFYKNNVSQGAITLPSSTTGWKFVAQNGGGSSTKTMIANFGQRPFAYTPPTGFRSLCTTNLPATAIGFGLTNQAGKYFNPVLYTGNGSTLSVTGVGFQPDFVWLKSRGAARSHRWWDVLRGATKGLSSDLTNAEYTESGLTAFDNDGFALGSQSGSNTNAEAFVAWNWKAGGTGVSNTAGTITSTVSANTTAGFSIVTYTGTGTNGATVGHGLGVVPDMIIIKRRNSTGQWATYHSSIGNTGALRLNTTSATITDVSFWNNTSPTSTVFTIGVDGDVNTNTGTYVAYCFDAVPGYSAFGSYTGNGSADGPFVYLGFRPRWVLFKVSSAAGFDWLLYDSSRNTYNVTDLNLRPDLSDAEGSQSANYLDFLSNGFKIRGTSSGSINPSQTIIYAAFAESPFQFANAR
jgi:hypothetical protein